MRRIYFLVCMCMFLACGEEQTVTTQAADVYQEKTKNCEGIFFVSTADTEVCNVYTTSQYEIIVLEDENKKITAYATVSGSPSQESLVLLEGTCDTEGTEITLETLNAPVIFGDSCATDECYKYINRSITLQIDNTGAVEGEDTIEVQEEDCVTTQHITGVCYQ